MSMESRFNCFKTKHNLDDSAMKELLSLFNDSFIELAHKLLESSPQNNSAPVKSLKTITPGAKKWATKIAAEYAGENNLTLDDFDKEKITKKDIDTYMKEVKSVSKKVPKLKTEKTDEKDETWYKSSPEKPKQSHGKCCGMNKSGDPCQKPGTTNPESSKNYYCFKHAIDWKNFEVSSDSDLDEETLCEEQSIGEICKIIESENELSGEN